MTLQLRPYQDEAATFLYEVDRALVLAPVGAGKTAISATGMAELVRDGHVTRWLVVAPKRVCTDVWPRELPKWAPALTFAVAVGTAAQRAKALAADVDVVIVNYDVLQKLENLDRFDGVVFDELTRLKNSSGKRFKAIDKLLERSKVEIRWGLTGSFTSNGLEDVYGQVRIVSKKLLGRGKTAFLEEYFICINQDFGEWTPRPNALEQVMAKIKPATFVLEPGVYKDQLPPCQFVPVPCRLEDRGPYDRMKKDFLERFPTELVIAQNAAVVSMKLTQAATGFMYGELGSEGEAHWFSDHKFDALDDILEENQRAPTIVVYNFKEELAELQRVYGKRLRTIHDKGVIDEWNAGRVEILAVQPQSAGHGLNLQFGGNRMVFLSLPWSLELFEQTVGRIHRGGQEADTVWVYVLQTENTIDERIWARLAERQSTAAAALEELRK